MLSPSPAQGGMGKNADQGGLSSDTNSISAALVSWGHYNKLPQMGVGGRRAFDNRNLPLHSLEAGGLRTRCQQGHFLLRLLLGL